uniref:F-box domain-containing protein n=1 Tax=Oryza meridionalis TaxID=40149 RepID=A0A0E0EBG6_9ORYZ
MASWSDLPSDMLGLVIARLPFPADRARFRAVCRAWHSALRRHVAAAPQLPWIVLPDGTFVTVSNGRGGVHRMPFPGSNAICVGSTDGWLALHRTDVDGAGTTRTRHTFLLHNPFTSATVPLAELGDILDDVFFEEFHVRKVIVRPGGPDGGGHLVAVMTDHWDCPLILCRPGKGTWTPEPCTMPFVRVIDIAFFQDKLYLIIKSTDLFAIDLADDEHGAPTVTNVERIIRHPRSHNSRFRWSDTEDDDAVADDDDGEGFRWSCTDYRIEEGDNAVDAIITTWNLVESRGGALLMVRREWLVAGLTPTEYTRKVDVFEADMDGGGGGAWVPVITGGLGGQAIFQSEVFCKSVPAPARAHDEMEEDVLYFVDTQDVWDMRSGARKPFKGRPRVYELGMTWLFPPELVV